MMGKSFLVKLAAGIIAIEVIIIIAVTMGFLDSSFLTNYIYLLLLALGGIYLCSKMPIFKTDLASAGLLIKASMYFFSVICSIALAILPDVKDPLFIIILSIVTVFVIDFIDVIFELINVNSDQNVINSDPKSSKLLTDISLEVGNALIKVVEEDKKTVIEIRI